VIDLKDKKNKHIATDIRFGFDGEAFLVADTRG